ncbi:hypothetical protein SEVIR_3G095800v4 [Setaria viridis]|uniref:Zinc finger PHD-type domain-containing protein n=1 Tax=Setaria viridis TaxID=4556 RepID=A0A4U6V7E0_SETVI|nr:protein ENHANCED DOWNY MILDEW 2-like isoform X2 [Setaria viridis]TKW25131.1 hypothetical protein SEVIR_3G095800v2 [Setaria viridis]
MAPVDTSRSDPRRPERGGGIDQKRSKPKPRYDGDDFCAICDNGGDVTCCDGGCQRSFHLTDENSERSRCRLILGLTKERAEMILAADDKDFICKNCKYKQHQCFACGELESSDLSSEPKVFQCEVDDCGRFYHPECVAKLLYPESELEASLFAVQVAAREKFTCPIHECIVCKGVENKNHRNMQFAVCRRCPTTYHRKCLPSNIPFETKKGPNGYMQRAWDEWEGPDGHVIPRDRILIYCTKHEIIKKLGTPKRNHIIFPDVKKLRVPKRLVDPPNEKGIPEEEVLKNTSREPSQSPPAVASDQNQCSCSGPFDSFAPESLFRHPYPGTCGWLGD